MKTMVIFGVLSLLASAVNARQAAASKPIVSPYKTDGVVPGFLVQATNTSIESLLVLGIGRCTPRIDGKEIGYGGGYTGGGRHVAPGETWKELWRLVVARDPSGRLLPNPAVRNFAGNMQIVPDITPGKHTIAFACGGPWSDDVTFEWKLQ